jgi:acyl-coenzyme A synthetase/AMP-(fatty) acid ligase
MADMLFAWHRGAPVSVDEFQAAARALSGALPRKPYVVNLCEDRYAFTVGFAASLIAGQTTLLPPSRAPEAVRDSCEGHDAYTLTDEEALGGGREKAKPFSVGPAHVAAVVFTSGSTGRPVAHEKTWGSLVAGARALATRIQAAGTIVGTVPPQHMFGLEATVMLPWQNGLTMHSGRPLLPADLGAALAEAAAPRWLMTSPLHLRACVAARQPLPGLAGVLSSTMPLDPQLAQDAEKLWGAPVFEIYGSSEAGMIATRRTALDQTWELCPGVHLTERGGEFSVQGGHILQPQRIADELRVRDARHFTLHGRKANLVKIAGKRTSIEALNAALLRVEGVRDGVFYLRDGAERVGALVVAPGLAPRALRAALRRHIDPAFLPRPLHFVAALPRSENGKLTRDALFEMVDSLESVSS